MRSFPFALLLPLSFVTATTARAEEPPPSESPFTPPVSQTDDDSWAFRYGVARDRLIQGDFHEAAEAFSALAAEAKDPSHRALAQAQAELARTWEMRGLVLVRRGLLRDNALAAKSVDERTTDELAILYLNSVLYGVGTGAWTSVLAKPDTTAGVILPILGFSGAAAGTVALIDTSHPFRYGVPQSIVSGMYVGFEEGLSLVLWNNANDAASARWSGETAATVMWGASTAGALAGGVVGSAVGTTPGRAAFVGSSALWSGLVFGLAAGALPGSDRNGGRTPFLASSIGIGGGALAGMAAAGPVSPSIARVRFLDLGGIAGGLVVGGLYFAAANRDVNGQALSGFTAAGMVAGLGAAWAATQSMPIDRPEDHRPEVKAASWSPTLVPSKDGMMLGIQGSL